jgi:flagellar motility protein MotE (MotC chaperone)
MNSPRLLPLLAVAICGVLALKVVSGFDGAPDFLKQAAAFAEDAAPGEKAAKGKPVAKKPAAKPAAAKAGPESAVAAADMADPASAVTPNPPVRICAPSAAELAKEAGLSPAELRVLQSLQSRRGELDQRATAMDTQLAVLSAAEAKLDAKLRTLAALKGELQGLLGQATQKEDAEVLRMVAVYQAMKPQDAAAVMTQLDDRVRVPVAAKMKERALAAILAKMPPSEAKKLTEKLALRFAASDVLAQKVKDEPAKPTQVAQAATGDAAASAPAAPRKAAPRKAAPRKVAAKAAPVKTAAAATTTPPTPAAAPAAPAAPAAAPAPVAAAAPSAPAAQTKGG